MAGAGGEAAAQTPGADAAVVLLSTEPPFIVRDANAAWCEMTGFGRGLIVGRTMRMLQGPATNTADLKALIQSVGALERNMGLLTLYMSSGEEFLLAIKVSPQLSDDGEKLCKAEMGFSDAMVEKIAKAEDGGAKVIFKVGKWEIEYVSESFCEMFQYMEQQVMGRGVALIHTPATDRKKWDEMVRLCCQEALTREEKFTLSDSTCAEFECRVRVIPVLDDKKAIGKVMMHFAKGDNKFTVSLSSSRSSSFSGLSGVTRGPSSSFDSEVRSHGGCLIRAPGGSVRRTDGSGSSQKHRSAPEMEHPLLPPARTHQSAAATHTSAPAAVSHQPPNAPAATHGAPAPAAPPAAHPGASGVSTFSMASSEHGRRQPAVGIQRKLNNIDRATMRHLMAMQKRSMSMDEHKIEKLARLQGNESTEPSGEPSGGSSRTASTGGGSDKKMAEEEEVLARLHKLAALREQQVQYRQNMAEKKLASIDSSGGEDDSPLAAAATHPPAPPAPVLTLNQKVAALMQDTSISFQERFERIKKLRTEAGPAGESANCHSSPGGSMSSSPNCSPLRAGAPSKDSPSSGSRGIGNSPQNAMSRTSSKDLLTNSGRRVSPQASFARVSPRAGPRGEPLRAGVAAAPPPTHSTSGSFKSRSPSSSPAVSCLSPLVSISAASRVSMSEQHRAERMVSAAAAAGGGGGDELDKWLEGVDSPSVSLDGKMSPEPAFELGVDFFRVQSRDSGSQAENEVVRKVLEIGSSVAHMEVKPDAADEAAGRKEREAVAVRAAIERCGDDRALVLEIAQHLVRESIPDSIEALLRDVRKDDINSAYYTLCNLIDAGETIGACTLVDSVAPLAQRAKDGTLAGAEDAVARAKFELTRLEAYWSKFDPDGTDV